MMKIVKTVLAVVMVFTLLFTAACGKNAPTADSQTTQASSASSETATSTEVPAYAQKYDPVITIEATHSLLDVDAKFKDGESLEDNVITRKVEEELGIKFNFRWAAGGDKSPEKMNLTIASGDLPDLFAVNRAQYEQLVAADQLEDLSPYLDTYFSDYAKEEWLYANNKGALKDLTIKGKVYGLPLYSDYTENAPQLWIRTDWLKNLGMNPPKTGQELFNIIEAFAAQDPDKNGQNDTYGMLIVKDAIWDTFLDMFHSYYAGNGFFMEDGASGKLVDGMHGNAEQQANTKAALLKLQEFYKKGYIPKDFGIQDMTKYAELINSGKCGLLFGSLWDIWWPITATPENIHWRPFPLVSADDKPIRVAGTENYISFVYVVRKGVSNPEALCKLANWYLEFSKPNDESKMTEEEKAALKKFNDEYGPLSSFKYLPVQLYPVKGNIKVYQKAKAYINNNEYQNDLGTQELVKSIRRFEEDPVKNVADMPNTLSYSDYGSVGVDQYYVDNGIHFFTKFVGSPTKTMLEKGSLIKKAWDETWFKIVMGADISEYDKFLEQAKSLGIEQIWQEVNDWHASVKQ